MHAIEDLKASYGPETFNNDKNLIPNSHTHKDETLHANFAIMFHQKNDKTGKPTDLPSFSMEDMLKDDDEDDFGFFPIKRPMLIEHYYDQRNNHWTPSDLDMTEDREDYDKCDNNIKEFINGILAFFVPADGLVVRNIFSRFQKDTSFWKEAVSFYSEQGSMETIHSEVYSLMADVLIRDRETLLKIQNSIKHYPSVKKIADFMKKYMSRDYTLAERILAFACIEGILFNSAFTAVRWLKKRNILQGFCKANEWIARDEGIHTRFAVVLFILVLMRVGAAKPTMEHVNKIVMEAVEVNRFFINEILKADLIGLSNEDLLKYTKCTADALLLSLGYPILYGEQNPFDWMSIITLSNKTNFFEGKVSEYAQVDDGEFVFDEDADV